MCQESCGARIPYVWQAVPQEEETLSIPDLASHTAPIPVILTSAYVSFP